jgi:Flp pilus assembly pilin Flp
MSFMLYIMSKYESLKFDRRGVTALEYAVVAAVIIGVVVTAMAALGTTITAKFTALDGLISNAGTTPPV